MISNEKTIELIPLLVKVKVLKINGQIHKTLKNFGKVLMRQVSNKISKKSRGTNSMNFSILKTKVEMSQVWLETTPEEQTLDKQ